MKYDRISRRHFLQGAGKSALALPFLPSLMPHAHADTLKSPKFLAIYWSGHGGINPQNMYPVGTNPAVAGQLHLQSLYASQNHNILSGKLVNLKTNRASNLPYLGTCLDGNLRYQGDGMPLDKSYALDPSGADFDGGAARLTPLIGNFVSDALLNKMNLIAGLDMMYYSGHGVHQTGNFCNFAGNNPTSASANGMTNVWVPTIDAVAAKYPAYYGSSTPVAPTVVLNGIYNCCDGINTYISAFNTPSGIAANGNIPLNLGAAFNLLFGSLAGTTDPALSAKKGFILNRVHADYARVARGAYGPGRRIGRDDRNRLEEFMTYLSNIISGISNGGTCAAPSISSGDQSQILSGAGQPASAQTTLHLYNQLMAAAFSCGLTQNFIFGVPGLLDVFNPSGSPSPTFSDGVTGPDSHQALFHQHNWANRQAYLLKAHRFYFQFGFYDFMNQLNSITAPQGGTLLDQTLMFWTQEAGFNTHYGNCLPMIMAGGAGGSIKTGNFVDYRNANLAIGNTNAIQGHVGVPYNRFLGTVLQALGVPPSAYELSPSLFAGTSGRIPISSHGTVPGYGHPFQAKFDSLNNRGLFLYDYQLNDMSVPLPIIT